MALWLMTILAAGFAGGLLILHGVGKTKLLSERMLDQYRTLLAEAREIEDGKENSPPEGTGP